MGEQPHVGKEKKRSKSSRGRGFSKLKNAAATHQKEATGGN